MTDLNQKSFKAVNNKQNFPQLEEEIQKFWNENNIFKKSIENRDKASEFVFYDGPPFATGLPHYGHILTSIAKDLIPRYKTMKGYKVERRWGWDCHGLPIENIVEKELNLSSHQEISDYGVDKFCEDCRSKVFTYADEWEVIINRIGRWVDFENQYRTMDPSFMETVWWIFKTLYDKGLIYEGYKVLPYCTRCHTPLSNFETKVDDAYRPKQDKTCTVKLKNAEKDNEYFLIWTTTPWTLPSNLAIAVGPEIEYVKVKDSSGELYILAESRLSAYYKNAEDYELLETVKGSDLSGLKYEPLFPYFEQSTTAKGQTDKERFKVILADFVTTEDGTGIVHMAPAFGEDDFNACKKENIAFFMPVDDNGEFTDEVPELKGKHVFEANDEILKRLKEEGKIIVVNSYEHSYPHCWRCDTPLIYKAISAWFVNIEPIKADMIASNQKVNWVPSHVRDGIFGKWLEGARDWCISRNRYWGSVLPVWKCDKCDFVEVFGNKKDLEEKVGVEITDLHKHFIDKHKYSCPKCAGGVMSRIPEVLDCWFESGAMPYAQVHYPFENKEWFDSHFPSDFIVEYLAQTRGWFYTMIVLSSALFKDTSFKNCVAHGTILAADGRKMSKRLLNFTDPLDLVNKYGADSMRLALMISPVMRGDDIRFSDDLVETMMKKVVLALWNSYSFFTTYANIDGWSPSDAVEKSDNELDKWIISELSRLNISVSEKLDKYDIADAGEEFISFLDSLNNWYIRRSRRRFWKSQNDGDKMSAYSTLYRVLKEFTMMISPFIPFTAEEIYKNLTGEESVHLATWPEVLEGDLDLKVINKMRFLRSVVNLALANRAKNKIKVRQPLNIAKIVKNQEFDLNEADLDVIKEEINVKKVEIVSDYHEFADENISVNAKLLGPKYGAEVQNIIKAARNGDFKVVEGGFEVGGFKLFGDEVSVVYKGKDGADNVEANNDAVIMLDLEITEELRKEGLLRDVIRLVQDHRKEMDYPVDAKIALYLDIKDEELKNALAEQVEFLKNETLSFEVEFTSEGEFHLLTLDEFTVGIRSEKK
ncbi:MAG: isoleucine--tRNA ligase [Candidatus Gracilibacteria bacterium]|jgi:isoleucyl-tRNA synthetase|nr:isoleucine--tRNA ligase [Candidatus Gracilibacteria bacterium]